MFHFHKTILIFFILLLAVETVSYGQQLINTLNASYDTTIVTSPRQPFVVNYPLHADSTIWELFTKKQTKIISYGNSYQSDSLISYGTVYVKTTNGWKYNSLSLCGINGPACEVSDLLEVNGFIVSVSNKYPIDTVNGWGGWQVTPGVINYSVKQGSLAVTAPAVVGALVISKGLNYFSSVTVGGLAYDSLSSNYLKSPTYPNATYTWYKDNILLPTVTTSSFLPTVAGKYSVLVQWVHNTTPYSVRTSYRIQTLATVTNVDQENESENAPKCYPNPANDFVFIQSNGNFDYSIDNSTGIQIASGKGYQMERIDISSFKGGVYFIHVNTQNGTNTQKIIVNKD